MTDRNGTTNGNGGYRRTAVVMHWLIAVSIFFLFASSWWMLALPLPSAVFRFREFPFQLHKNVGDLLYRAGRFDEALEAYGRAVRADASLGDDVYLRLGNLRYRRGEHAEAERCWTRALELDPTNAIVRSNLAAVRRTVA